jgi:hypothetical protein
MFNVNNLLEMEVNYMVENGQTIGVATVSRGEAEFVVPKVKLTIGDDFQIFDINDPGTWRVEVKSGSQSYSAPITELTPTT